MKSTETDQKTRPNLDALIQEVTTSTFRDRYTAKEAKSLSLELAVALAAERDRADRAETRIKAAPHDEDCTYLTYLSDSCTCWKSEATA